MAKKKVTHTQDSEQVNPYHQNHKGQHQPQKCSMEDLHEKLQNLKSFNALLIKETFERRQQVESLVKTKEGLEATLNGFVIEKTGLETELTRTNEDMVRLEIEKDLFCAYIETKMNDMRETSDLVEVLERANREKECKVGILESEVKRVTVESEKEKERVSQICQERDLLRTDVKNWVKQNDELKAKMSEVERRERECLEEIADLKKKYSFFIKEKKEREREIEEVKKMRDLAENKLVEKVREVEQLRMHIEGVVGEKDVIKMENSGLKIKIGELEKDVKNMSENMLSLKTEEGVLRQKILELEKSRAESMEKEKIIARELDGLVEEEKEKERNIERLMEEKVANQKLIHSISVEIEDKNGLIEKLLRENRFIEEAKAIKESEVMELHSHVDGLRDHLLPMQESIKEKDNNNKQLTSEISHLRDAFERVKLEKDSAQKDLDDERKNCVSLMSKVVEMEKMVEETFEELAKMKSKCVNLIKEKKEIMDQIGFLDKEKALVRKKLLDAQGEIEDLSSGVESAGSKSERTLIELKNTVALVCQSNNGKEKVVVTEKKIDAEIDSYATELEVIKNAFRNKEIALEEMKKQVELLQNSVAKAKKTGFWTIVSSASTVLAAAFIAYVARLR